MVIESRPFGPATSYRQRPEVIESLRNRAGLAPGPLENSATTPSKMTPAERANEIEAAERTRRWNKAAAEAREARQRAKRQARLAEEDY